MKLKVHLACLILFISIGSVFSQESNPIEGTWDIVMNMEGRELPSWLEIHKSGHKTLVGHFVFAFGSARPIGEVKLSDDKFSFSLPPQWEPGDAHMEFEGTEENGELKGTMKFTNGKIYDWTATRAPKLPYNENPVWSESIPLFNGKDLNGWNVLGENQWVVEEGVLKNTKAGGNLVTEARYTDFKLHVEFRYPEGSNSGIYLRGRYEVQIADNKGLEPNSLLFGGVYGFLTPNEMVAKNPSEWQEYDITLIGRRVTIVANGKAIITSQNIPGITGGALDSREAEPGPILIQGDHGPVEFRNITIIPVAD